MLLSQMGAGRNTSNFPQEMRALALHCPFHKWLKVRHYFRPGQKLCGPSLQKLLADCGAKNKEMLHKKRGENFQVGKPKTSALGRIIGGQEADCNKYPWMVMSYLIYVFFSPQVQFLVQFFSTQKRLNRYKTNFATKKRKLQQI